LDLVLDQMSMMSQEELEGIIFDELGIDEEELVVLQDEVIKEVFGEDVNNLTEEEFLTRLTNYLNPGNKRP